MHTDVRTLDDDSLIEGDLCIVGAGAAGISMALEWVGRNEKVILLEGGGFEVEYDVQDLYAGESVGQRYYPLQSARLHYFGGTTGHWGGWSAPFDPQDFKKRDWVPHSGWPFEADELDPYYARATQVVELEKTRFEVADWEDPENGYPAFPLDEAQVRTKMWQLSPPTRFGQKYRDTILEAANIHLYTYANVTEIIANEEVSEITGLQVKTLTGKTHTVRAKRYVLACGAMQNARMLLASNKQAPRGLGNDRDLVGRYFMEHLEVSSATLHFGEPFLLGLYLVSFFETKAFGELALSEEKQRELRVLNGTTSMRPGAPGSSAWSIENYPDDAAETVQRWVRMREQYEANKGTEKPPPLHKDLTMQVRLEQAPNPHSRVMLSEEKDALGVPRVKLDWQLTSLDKHSIKSLYEVVGQEMGRVGLARVKMLDWLLDDDPMWPTFLGGGWHHMGTARMNTDPNQGVLDSNCKLHGISNLYIAGSAAFPTAGAANPTLTIIALTLRLSDHLKSTSG